MPKPKSHPFDALSAIQVETLRCVYERKTSKEIARLMHVSPHTVDERMRRIIRILRVSSRIEAARLWESYGNNSDVTPYQSLTYQPITLEICEPLPDPHRGLIGDGFEGELPLLPTTIGPTRAKKRALKRGLSWGTLILSSSAIAFIAIPYLLVGLGRNLN